MKQQFKVGDIKKYSHRVSADDFARFNGDMVHPVYSTFALARDAEWTTRQFVLEMKDDDEEGIGTFVHVDHRSPAFENEDVSFEGVIEQINGNELICSVVALVDERIVATIKTGQKILKKEKLKTILARR
jgi:fluoroacetyl-CoA thioesterase